MGDFGRDVVGIGIFRDYCCPTAKKRRSGDASGVDLHHGDNPDRPSLREDSWESTSLNVQ